MKTPTALVLFFCAGSVTPEVTERPLLKFHGNVAFDEVVYRSTLDLPENARAIPAEALALSAKLLGFLRRAGYDLATVRAKVEGEQISVEIDEGRLDKIIVLGEGLMETFRFKLELALPAGVFNRPILERQLRVLAERYRLRRVLVRARPGRRAAEQRTPGRRAGVAPGPPRHPPRLALRVAHPHRDQPVVAGVLARDLDRVARRPRSRRAVSRAGLSRAGRPLGTSRQGGGRAARASRFEFVARSVDPCVRPGAVVLPARVDRVTSPRADGARGPLVAPALRPAPRQLPSGHLFRIRRRERVPAACDGRPGSGNRAAVPPFARQGDRGQSFDRRDTARSDPPLRRSDRGDRLQPGRAAHRPQEPAGFRGARLLRIDFQRQGSLD